MKAFRHLIAGAALAVCGLGSALASGTTFVNGSFDDGLNGWSTLGDVSVQTYQGGTNPRAVLTTAVLDGDPLGDEFFNLSGESAAYINDVEAFAGVDPYALDITGSAVEGSVIKQTVNVLAGDTLNLNFWFGLVSQETDILGFEDVAFVAVNGQVVEVLSLTDAPRVGAFSYAFLTGGVATIAFGIVDINDVVGVSEFRIDNITVSAVPEPEAIAMLLAGLGVVGAAVRRRQGQAKA